MAGTRAAAAAASRSTAAHRSRLSATQWADLRRAVLLAREIGEYSASVGGVTINVRLPQAGAAAGRQPRRSAGRAEQAQQPSRGPCDQSSSTGAGAVASPSTTSAGGHTRQPVLLNSKQRRSNRRAADRAAARRVRVRGYLLRLLRDWRHARMWRIAAPVLSGPLADRGRLAAPQLNAASAAPAAAAGSSLLMQTVEGRVAYADALVGQINAAEMAETARSKRAAESSPRSSPLSAGHPRGPPHPRSRQRGAALAPNALFARVGAGEAGRAA